MHRHLLLTPDGLDMETIVKNYKIPPNFQVVVMIDSKGKKFATIRLDTKTLLTHLRQFAKREEMTNEISILNYLSTGFLWRKATK